MASPGHVLEVGYGDAEAFGQDYQANLSSGGIFVATERCFGLREVVVVRLRLEWCDREIDLEGEVVHVVPVEMAELGGRPGVAVQFFEPRAALCERLEPLVVVSDAKPAVAGRDERIAVRKPVRVPARLDTDRGFASGTTRNLSCSGVLIGLDVGSIPVGEPVAVSLRHPTSGEELAIGGRVVREFESGGVVTALAVHFDAEATSQDAVERFIGEVQGIDHARRLGGISGPFAELGPQSVVQMFASTAPRGTIRLRRGEEEGIVCFEAGRLRAARTGSVSGIKALVRMLAWVDGTFEFHSSVEEVEEGEDALSLEAAVFDAMRQIDEGERLDGSSFPLQARLVSPKASRGEMRGGLSVLEEALLDLAGAGFTVQRALEVIPEPDAQIFAALRSLVDSGVIELH